MHCKRLHCHYKNSNKLLASCRALDKFHPIQSSNILQIAHPLAFSFTDFHYTRLAWHMKRDMACEKTRSSGNEEK